MQAEATESPQGAGPAPGRLARVAEHAVAAPLLVGLVAFAAAALVSLRHPAVPQIHDEFAYALLADTFLEGRLTNPPHPLWQHLDTIHVLQQPTYAAKYPPLQGAALALGELVAGRAAAGVWLSFGAACALLTWMLRAWVPPRWALLGGLVVALSGQLVVFWGTLFWGGALAMGGGALVYGAARRLVDRRRALDAAWLGLGLAVLALSRPFEGLAVALPAVLLVAVRLRRDTLRVALPLAAPVALGLGFLAYYDWRVTGSPWTLPYALHSAQYCAVPELLFLDPRPRPTYTHPILEFYYAQVSAQPYFERQSWKGFASGLWTKAAVVWTFFPLFSLSVALLALPWVLRDRWMRFLTAAGVPLLVALAVETYELPHYAAPGLCLIAALVMAGLARWWRVGPGPLGKVVVVLAVAGGLVEQTLGARHHLGLRAVSPLNDRAQVEEDLERQGGQHLVLVRYMPWHNPHHEWVYNAADVDAAPVVWARELDPARDRRLLRHFADRKVWVLLPDTPQMPTGPLAPDAKPPPPRLVPAEVETRPVGPGGARRAGDAPEDAR